MRELPKGPWWYEYYPDNPNQARINNAEQPAIFRIECWLQDAPTEAIARAICALPALIEGAMGVLEAEEYGNDKTPALKKFIAALRIVDGEPKP